MAGLIPDKHATLGFVPGLDTITEEAPESSVRPSNTFHFNDEAPAEINEAQLNEDDQELSDNNEARGEQPNEANSMATILKNVDYVIQSITSSAAKWSEFNWQSRDRAYKARYVIGKLLELERDQHLREREFYFITKKMEGDHSSASLMLEEYQYIRQFLNSRLTPGLKPKFTAMICKMLTKTETYLNEALQCNAILLATMLHPSYQLSIFQRRFFDHHLSAKRLREERFKQRQDELKSKTGFTQTPPQLAITTPAPKHCRVAGEEYFPATDEPQADDKLTTYIGGKYRLPADQADESLHWWKVHHQEFPVLALLAKNYLACTATSASVERCFSAAADICGHDQGSLGAQTIKRCVNSHERLQQQIQANGEFNTAQRIINCVGSHEVEGEGSQDYNDNDLDKEME
ncbi:hypothetical protein MJO28_013918 [Puccinia striiformis f. sp. tritici]|uniref:Uncharacterized protein n=1 Tax=Puccinia striiformis f. sp. tritici TaxID=168172 RepID=A0ACC0DVY6_9BASI|nr:hypothetical protein MJO28_013918 [Puccinia striiformis f. sp. tritici]